jgi:uncharacterized protein (TIGR03000 family)
MDLPALAGLGLLLVGGLAKADQQGWPVAGDWSNGGFYSGGYSPSFSAGYPATYGSYTPSYPIYESSILPNTGYYGAPMSGYGYSPRATGGYYGSLDSENYYATPTNATSTNRPVHINLRVPADAKVWFDGVPTNQAGTTRSFESPPLPAGREYAYQIRAQWLQDGKDVAQTRRISVHAGDIIDLALGFAGSR